MPVADRFIIKLSGKEFVLFAGLLDAATQAGLTSVSTDVVQIPSPENGNMAVVQATVLFADGRSFQGTGDASPESVGRMILPHLLRMAETRAIGRSLCWALNVSVTMREELGEDTDGESGHRGPSAARTARPAPSATHRATPAPAEPPTVLCSVDGCGCILNADEQKANARYWPDREPVCKTHARERLKEAQAVAEKEETSG